MTDRPIDTLDLGGPSREFRVSIPDAEHSDFRTRVWADGIPDGPEELQPHYPTLVHAFFHTLRVGGDTGITLYGEGRKDPVEHRSYADLARESRHLAARLAGHGIGQGDRVLLLLPTSFELISTFFALQLLRAVPVPAYPPAMLERAELALEKLGLIADHSDAKMIVTNRKLRVLMGEIAESGRPVVTTERLLGDGRKASVPQKVRKSETAFIQYTSGSTGHPKGVMLSHRNVCANVHAIGQAIRVNRNDVVVSWLPLYHDMGLIGALLFSIYWRLPLVLLSPSSFLIDPRRWLEAITEHRGTLSPSPNFGYARCLRRVRNTEGIDLSSWRCALNGAEPVSAQTLDEFAERFQIAGFERTAFFPVYGLAETSLAATFPEPGTAVERLQLDRQQLAHGQAIESHGPGSTTVVSVGSAVPGHEVQVVDAHGVDLPDNQVGHIVISGPSVMEGYYDAPEVTHEVKRGDTLWTGDLGFFRDGNLYVTGRVKDLIIVRGKNYYAEDVERIVESIDHARAGCVVAFGVYDEEKQSDLLVVVAETRLTDDDERKALADVIGTEVQERCGLQVDEVVLLPPGGVPKTSSGKRQRALCRDLHLQGELGKERRTGKLGIALAFVRSGMGFATAAAGRLVKRRPTVR
ncbi:MAG: fatty acyl-AMP ligase [Deltaproteobacteria bacterium]|nr:fatty acyl-AMP ligase [Deltaproteobacteria bacterium]